jgi:hypothetical protein
MRLLPTLAVIYAFALIDRVNLPNVCASHSFPPSLLTQHRLASLAWTPTCNSPSAIATPSSP